MDLVVEDATKEVAKDAQKRLYQVHRQYAGQPVSEVWPALRKTLLGSSINPDRAQFNDWSTLMNQGTRIEFKA